MLVRNVISEQFEIPGEPGQWMKFRRLSGRRIADCSDRRQQVAFDKMRAMGPDALAFIRGASSEDKTEKKAQDPMDMYDHDMLLKLGIASWSYGENVAEALADEEGGLDAATSKWAVHKILEFNGLLPEEKEAELGN